MKLNSPLYYCTECKAVVNTLDKLLFVEDNSNKGFCSEDCIEDFYRPLSRHFERLVLELRTKYKIEKEYIETGLSNKDLVEIVLKNPGEVWSQKNDLQEVVFTYIKHFETFSSVVICTVYNGEASFIYLTTETKSRELLSELRSGTRMTFDGKANDESQDHNDDIGNDEDFNFMQLLENKKSKLLAELLIKRLDSDISFEDFTQYESCFSECLNQPDEVFEIKDNEGDIFFNYSRSYVREKENFFYIISCLKRKDAEDANSISVFPVLAFPTKDMDIFQEFRAGKKISGQINN